VEEITKGARQAAMKIPYVIDNQTHCLVDALKDLLAGHAGKSLDIATVYFTAGVPSQMLVAGFFDSSGTPSRSHFFTRRRYRSRLSRLMRSMNSLPSR
jgi:hypothetical protein